MTRLYLMIFALLMVLAIAGCDPGIRPIEGRPW